MLIDSDSDSNVRDVERAGTDIAGSAYRESITSVDGFTRGPNGRVKFNKDTKKRRRENNETEDLEMGDAEGGSAKSKKNKRKSEVKLGHEFKAKVTYFCNSWWDGELNMLYYRTPEVMLKRVAWILMHTCHCLRLRRKEGAAATALRLASRASDDCTKSATILPEYSATIIHWMSITTW
jgi:hypothetical protein